VRGEDLFAHLSAAAEQSYCQLGVLFGAVFGLCGSAFGIYVGVVVEFVVVVS
jgi:hypothetical protein